MSPKALTDAPVPLRVKLAALWTALMVLYAYADLLFLYKPGQIDKMRAGMMGPFEASQGSLLAASLLMALPALMIFLSLALPPKATRTLNIALGALYTLVNVANLIGESWAFYFAFGIIEIGVTLAIIGYAWRWPAPAPGV